MSETAMQAFNLPSAWKATDYQAKDAFAIDLEPRHIEALNAEVARFKATGGGHEHEHETFPLSKSPTTSPIGGTKCIPTRHDPATRRADREYRPGRPPPPVPWPGSHFGRPVSQSNMGELVGEVVNIGNKDPKERAYRSSRELMLHTDRADHIAMLCICPAIEGGLSGYAGTLNIHNIMLEERPDLLAHLDEFHHRFGNNRRANPW